MRLPFRPALAATVVALAAFTSQAVPIQVGTAPEATRIQYKTVEVDGINIFYREAGDRSKPTILLLHGFPTSSNMFRNLLPLLSTRFHLIAPDYPGFGFSEAPGPDKFKPTFENLTRVMNDFVQAVGARKFTLYMQDFGGPIGFRMALAHPEWMDSLIIQNANAYQQGIAPDVLKQMKARAAVPPRPEDDKALEQMLSADGTKMQYLAGARNPAEIDPTSYSVDTWVQAMPEQHRIQKALIVDYYDNVLQYPVWHRYLAERQPKTLIVWGKNDPIFLTAGANAYLADIPNAEVHFFDTGHFALEEDAAGIAQQIIRFYGK